MSTKNPKEKQVWETPKLKVHGTVEEITHQINKHLGLQDNLVNIINSPLTLGS